MLLPVWAAAYRPVVVKIRRSAGVANAATAASALCESLGLAVLGLAAMRKFDTMTAAFLIAAAIATVFILSSIAKALADREYAHGQVRLESQLRAQVTDAILTSDWQDFVDQPGHELQSAAIAEAPQVAQATMTYVRARGAVAGAAIIFACTLLVSAFATLICAAFSLAIVFVYRRSARGLRQVQMELANGNTEITRQTSILVSSLRSLRLSPIQEEWRADLQGAFDAHAEARKKDLTIPVRGRFFVESLAGLMIFTVLVVQQLISGSLLPGLIVMAMILRILPRVQAAQQLMSFAQHGVLWIDRWDSRFARLHLQESGTGHLPRSGGNALPDTELLRVEGVSFNYRGHDKAVLENINLRLRAGEWVSLRGVSGGGKSTLIDVIGGILIPARGRILVRSHDIADLDISDLYREVVIVPQDVHLLGETVFDIVTWGGRVKPGEDFNDIIAALGVDRMFLFSGNELNHKIDELSRDISGGMRTRLAMARALISHPSVLILDETTSRLHPEAEAEIFGAVRKLRPDLAVLVVTHREETESLVERHLVLTQGRLLEGKG